MKELGREIPRPDCDGRLIMVVIWEFGTAERIIGRTNERERFFVSLPASDGAFGATLYVPLSIWTLRGDFSSIIPVEE